MKDSRPKKTKKENKKLSPSTYLLLLIGATIACLSLLNYDLFKRKSELVLSLTHTEFAPAPYPSLSLDPPLNLSAAGAAVLDSDSHVLVFSKNPTRFFSPASTTKILTALVALDKFKPEDIMTVYSDDVEGSTIGLKIGDRLSLESLLYAMMLPSSNEAAIAISENFPGGKEAFVIEMNRKAKSLGLLSTHIEDPVGLKDEANITTPHDLVILGDLSMRNKKIAEIVRTKTKTISTLDGKQFHLSNLNILLGRDDVEGVKTGFTETSGEVLVTSKNRHGKRLLIVVMQSENRFGDTLEIINRIDAGLTYLPIQR